MKPLSKQIQMHTWLLINICCSLVASISGSIVALSYISTTSTWAQIGIVVVVWSIMYTFECHIGNAIIRRYDKQIKGQK